MATYFWVGGAGTWDSTTTTNWALTSGGLPGVAAPNNTDTVNFDANSGTGTVSVAATAVSLNTTLNSANINLSLTGSPTLCTTAGTFTFTLGTLTLNTFTLTCGRFSSTNANVRTIAFGTGNITLTGNGATIWTTATATNLTITGTPTVNATYSGASGTRVVAGSLTGVSESNVFNFNITAGTDIFNTSGTAAGYGNLNFTGFSGSWTTNSMSIYGNLTLSATMTAPVGSTLTFAATSAKTITTNTKTLDSNLTFNGIGGSWQLQDNLTNGATRTTTLTAGTLDLSVGNRTLSTGLFSSSNSNTRSTAFGTGNITVTGNGATVFTISDSTNLTISGTPTVNLTYSGATGTRQINASLTSASANTALNYNISAGSDTVTFGTSARVVNDVNFTGFSGTITDLAKNFYGNLTLAATNVSVASTSAVTFRATSGTKTITTAGLSFNFPLTFDGVGGTFAFQDALTQGSTQAFTVTNGTVQLKNGATSTVGAFSTSGTNQKFLQSTSPGLQATLSQASGTVDASYLTIQDINATGGATWNAFVNQQNVDAGNNDGWDFGISPIVGSYEYTYQLRSFTQPRRF
jgi:hypothetical protein